MSTALEITSYILNGYIDICGKKFCARRAFMLPMGAVENTYLTDIQKLFDEYDLAHTAAANTILYLIESNHRYQLLWVCNHFEDATFVHMVQLCGIMSAMTHLSSFDEVDNMTSVSIELLDTFAEKLIISIDGVHDRILARDS